MHIIGIDPGPKESSLVGYRTESQELTSSIFLENEQIRVALCMADASSMIVIEWPQSYGKSVGESVFTTCLWVGMLLQAWTNVSGSFGGAYCLYTRPSVHLALFGNRRAKNAEINSAIYNEFGGDRHIAFGTKKAPGPLYGLKGQHQLDALAVALAYHREPLLGKSLEDLCKPPSTPITIPKSASA